MLQTVKVSDLKDHPENRFYFDDMSGGKWEDFLESIQDRGVIEPPIVTDQMVIVGGHQRIRACRELGIDEVECEVRHYENDADVLRDLIEMNIQQRGEITCSRIKKARIIKAMDEIYGVKRGGDKKSTEYLRNKFGEKSKGHGDPLIDNTNLIKSKLGISDNDYKRIKRLNDLVPELQDAVNDEKLPFAIASGIISKLSVDEQKQLASLLPDKKISVKQTQEYIDMVKHYDAEIATLTVEKEGLKRKADEMTAEAAEAVKAIKLSQDSGRYMEMSKQLEDERAKARREYENAQKIRQQLLRANEDSNKKIRDMEKRLKEAEQRADRTPETVYPDDYEQMKEELETLKSNAKVVVEQNEGSNYSFLSRIGAINSELESMLIRVQHGSVHIVPDYVEQINRSMNGIINTIGELQTIVKEVEVA